MRTAIEVLRIAAELAERVGVTRFMFIDPDTGSMCIDGLIIAAVLEKERNPGSLNHIDFAEVRGDYGTHDELYLANELYLAARKRVSDVLMARKQALLHDNLSALADWNNTVARDGEVVEVLKIAAATRALPRISVLLPLPLVTTPTAVKELEPV